MIEIENVTPTMADKYLFKGQYTIMDSRQNSIIEIVMEYIPL